MRKSLIIRTGLVVIVLIASVIYLIPSVVPDLPDFWKKYLPTDKIPLGLDLQGGTHLVLEVDTERALETTLQRMTET